MKTWKWCLPVLAVSLAACSAENSAPEPEQTEGLGQLELALTGTDTSGRQYRLRNAEFEIYGYANYGDSYVAPFVVSSETDPDAPYITQRLVPGDYYVNFISNAWYLERLTENGYETVEQAVLLSQRWQWIYLWDNATSAVFYRFGVDGELIDFRHADLNIGIEIEQPGDYGAGGSPGWADGGGVAGAGGTWIAPDATF